MLISSVVYGREMWLSAVEELKGFSFVCPPDNKDYRSPLGPARVASSRDWAGQIGRDNLFSSR